MDVDLLSGALEMSHLVLQQDPCQMASQLMGRLGQLVIEDCPVAKGIQQQGQQGHCVQVKCYIDTIYGTFKDGCSLTTSYTALNY